MGECCLVFREEYSNIIERFVNGVLLKTTGPSPDISVPGLFGTKQRDLFQVLRPDHIFFCQGISIEMIPL